VARRSYVPARGDLVWLSFTPQAGHEQAGRRPAIVLSPSAYNRKVGLAIVCPIASQVKGYPFEVGVPPGLPVTGVGLADHVRNVDWRARRAEFIGRLPDPAVNEIVAVMTSILLDDDV
jgi:mRNA interferase MazF